MRYSADEEQTARPNDSIHTAYHEAGHAVVGRILGLTCGDISIVADSKDATAGHAITHVERSVHEWEQRGRWRYRSLYRAGIMMLMAGREAEVVCLGHCEGGDGDDQYQIACHHHGEAEIAEEDLPRWRYRTRQLCLRHAEIIKRVAQKLLERKELDAKEVDALVRNESHQGSRRT